MPPPRVYTTEGLILRRRNLGEADSIFTFFTRDQGKLDAIARGVRKARSKMRGHLEPLSLVRAQLARGRTLDVFTQVETLRPYRAIKDDLDRTALALYAADLADRVTAEHQPQADVLDLLLEGLDAIGEGSPAHLLRAFDLQILALAGYEVQLDVCVLCDGRLEPEETLLSPAAGGLVCRGCRPRAPGGRLIGVRAVKALRYARRVGLAEFGALAISPHDAVELRSATGDVIRYTLERELPTARHLDQLARLPPAVTGT